MRKPKYFNGTPRKLILVTDREQVSAMSLGDTHPEGGTLIDKKSDTDIELCFSESIRNCLKCNEAHVCPLYNARLRI